MVVLCTLDWAFCLLYLSCKRKIKALYSISLKIWKGKVSNDGTDHELCKTGTDCCSSSTVFIGMGLKQSQTVKDKYIPLILGGIGIVLCAVWVIASCPISTGQEIAMAVFTAIVQGILVAGLSTYVNQAIKQMHKEE